MELQAQAPTGALRYDDTATRKAYPWPCENCRTETVPE